MDQAWLSAEIARRCFWAVWFTQCINSDNQLTDIVFSDQVMNLPLPISESSFLRSRPERTLRSLSLMHDTPTNAADTDALAKPSILSELMGIMFYWSVLSLAPFAFLYLSIVSLGQKYVSYLSHASESRRLPGSRTFLRWTHAFHDGDAASQSHSNTPRGHSTTSLWPISSLYTF